jgi:uncharacterized coiled-coil DUF342 family protein
MASELKKELLARKRRIEEKMRPFQDLQRELDEVNKALNALDRGGWEKPGHENGCRCRECDPSW